MGKKISRRDFMKTGAAAGIAAATPGRVLGRVPTMLIPGSVKPVVVASRNGNTVKNGSTMTCVETAFDMMTKGEDVLDALIAGVNIVELDPEDSSVGYGGRPNADGIVQLDEEGCISCYKCVEACPFGAMYGATRITLCTPTRRRP